MEDLYRISEKRTLQRTSSGRFASGDLAARFARKHEVVPGSCWTWNGRIDRNGFGRFWAEGKMDLAHRVAYRLHVGEIPDGWVVRQTCRNRACVNPDHLEVAARPRVRKPLTDKLPKRRVYGSRRWKLAREAALRRDNFGCTVSGLLGGECKGVLHVHHIVPLEEGGEPFDLRNLGTACARHHSYWETLRAEVLREEKHLRRCPHHHPTRQGREACERRLNAAA